MSPGNPTPENVIFFSKRVPENNKGDKPKNKVEKLDKNPSDPQIIKFYVQTCKITNKSEVQTIRWDNLNFEGKKHSKQSINIFKNKNCYQLINFFCSLRSNGNGKR